MQSQSGGESSMDEHVIDYSDSRASTLDHMSHAMVQELIKDPSMSLSRLVDSTAPVLEASVDSTAPVLEASVDKKTNVGQRYERWVGRLMQSHDEYHLGDSAGKAGGKQFKQQMERVHHSLVGVTRS
jgi:hypothetical protein